VAEVLAHPDVRARYASIIDALAAQNTGMSTFVARAVVLEEPPSAAAREITDKGSINQKAVLHHRRALVDDLYDVAPSSRVIEATTTKSVQ
jgi:feruloyl-CoA synthase